MATPAQSDPRRNALGIARRGNLKLALAIASCAGLALILTLDGPGLTIDEPLDVRPGRTYWKTLAARGWDFFQPDVVDQVFRDNAEHPPLGRWLLGAASIVGEPFEVLWHGPDPTGQYVLAGRLAPAMALAVLVAVVVHEGSRHWGTVAGAAGGIALVMMPRVFAHGHLAALDTFLSLFWTTALLAANRAIDSRRPTARMAVAGCLWSLAILTKIHAWFLLPLVAVWALFRLPTRRAVLAALVWAAVGIGLYFVGWPWLWHHTPARFLAYLGTGVSRATIQVEYFGRVYADRDVPWHYPWFYFAVTVPLGVHLLAALGLARGWLERRVDPVPMLLAGSILTFLGLFSTTVPVYDGERLFLHVFPAWALLAGRGLGWLWNHRRATRVWRVALGAFLLAQSYGIIAVHPFGLSYFNALVGGLRGAEALGLELTYWNDAVDHVLLDRLAREAVPGSKAALVPTLYPGQGILTTNRALARRDIILQDEAEGLRAEWVVLSRRTAYWRPEIRARLKSGTGREVANRSRQGVWLSSLWQFPIARPARTSRSASSTSLDTQRPTELHPP